MNTLNDSGNDCDVGSGDDDDKNNNHDNNCTIAAKENTLTIDIKARCIASLKCAALNNIFQTFPLDDE